MLARRDQNPRARRVAAEVRRRGGDRSQRRRRLPRQQRPVAIARDYVARLTSLTRRALAPGLEEVRERMPVILRRARGDRFDAAEDDVRAIMTRAEAAGRRATRQGPVERLAREFGVRTQTFQRLQILRQTRAALGIDVTISDDGLSDIMNRFARENAELIRDVPERVVREVSELSLDAVETGRRWESLSKDIDRRVGIGERRARLIARDQVGKLYGQVNNQRQKNLGVTHFFWRTVGDRRVRGLHAALEGERFPIDEGHPSEGLPGEPVLCRCFQEADYTGILGLAEQGGV